MKTGKKNINERAIPGQDIKLHRRAYKDKLEVVLRKCPECGHHKAFATDAGMVKCTRCKHVHRSRNE